MNEQDKARVDAAKAKKGKSQSKAGQSAQAGASNMQENLMLSAEAMGHMLADNFGSHALITMAKDVQTGNFGPKTTSIIEAITTGSLNPLEDWNQQIDTWTQPVALLAPGTSGTLST